MWYIGRNTSTVEANMSSSGRERKCSKEKDGTIYSKRSKRICLPIEREEYERVLLDKGAFRAYLDMQIVQHPELFPSTIQQGYKLHDILPSSKKMPDIRLRRIKVKATAGEKEVFAIAPSFVMPYMTGYTDDVEKALFLRKFAVPYWALTYVFGRNDMYWERLELGIGRNSIVGTTVKRSDKLPQDVLADEKHTRLNGEKAYVATTVGDDCVLGASVALQADTANLTEAYGRFKVEAQNLVADYEPQTVNIDGWKSTWLAWQSLFSSITIILCFLHGFIKIRDRCKRMKAHFSEICQRVWDVYHAADKQAFLDKVNDLKTWASTTIEKGTGLDAILKLCHRAPEFARAFDYPSAYRTSNMIDRHMEPLDRYLYSAKYFHGHLTTAEYGVRAWALLHNFQPYCPRSKVAATYQSPAHKLNGLVYHDNWLQNLLVSASMGGYRG
jgi:hypothetical protein